MLIHLKNKDINVSISKNGAELVSMKRVGDEREYIWKADPDYWKRHAPVLFPIVGKVVKDQYSYKDRTYHLGQHGFARDMAFEIIDLSDNEVNLCLKWNNETLNMYPFRFEFYVRYTLSENRLIIEYKVINLDEETIYFSLGAHPGFNCPFNANESFEDYYFEFEFKEEAQITNLDANGLLLRDKKQYLNNENIINLNSTIFKEDALVFDHLKSKSIWLKSRKSDYCIQVDFEGFPFLGLWSIPTGAPFVCIEPWIGHADYADFTGDFSVKEDQVCLDVGKSFLSQFSIKI